MTNGKKIFLGIVLVFVFVLGVALGNYLPAKIKAKTSPEDITYTGGDSYSVVYLSSGDVYIGKLTIGSQMELNDSYLLQNVKDAKDATKSSVQLTPLKEALWAPKQLFLNEKNVIFYGPLDESSKAAEALRNAKK